MSGGGAAVIGVREERARIGNLEFIKERAVVAIDEGFVAVEMNRVEMVDPRPGLESLPQRPIPMLTPAPAPEREYPWYDFRGKGCVAVILLLLFYLLFGAIFLPLMIIWALIYCLHCLFCSSSDD